MRYILIVPKSFIKITGKFIALVAISTTIQVSARSPRIVTKSKRPGHFISDNPTMKTWLKKLPGAFSTIPTRKSAVKITNIDVKWKQTNTVRSIAKTRRKTRTEVSHTCELRLTINYQDTASREENPEMVTTARPITVNSRCDTFLAKNNLVPVEYNPNT